MRNGSKTDRQKTETDNTLGRNIRRLRRQQGLNQDMLAAELNMLRQTISSYERGITLPDVFVLIAIADYFGVTMDELSGRKELIIPDEKE